MDTYMNISNYSIDKLNRLRQNCGLHDDIACYAKRLMENLATWPNTIGVDVFPLRNGDKWSERGVIVTWYGPGHITLDFTLNDDIDND
jgi:hypothetical protein